eukprot:COSAG02_NODE_754_length_17578_cov_97.544825_19_plen_71_part_01
MYVCREADSEQLILNLRVILYTRIHILYKFLETYKRSCAGSQQCSPIPAVGVCAVDGMAHELFAHRTPACT